MSTFQPDYKREAHALGMKLEDVQRELEKAGIPWTTETLEGIAMLRRWGPLARVRFWPARIRVDHGTVRCWFLGHIHVWDASAEEYFPCARCGQPWSHCDHLTLYEKVVNRIYGFRHYWYMRLKLYRIKAAFARLSPRPKDDLPF